MFFTSQRTYDYTQPVIRMIATRPSFDLKDIKITDNNKVSTDERKLSKDLVEM
jgi:hypothetical protein